MDARDLLLDLHSLAHSPAVDGVRTAGTEKPIPDGVWSTVQESQLRQTLEGHTSVAWLLWHTARAEDMGVNAIVRDVPEVFDRDGWAARLKVDLRHAGTGMSHDEAKIFSERIDAVGLIAYRDAVGRETRAWLQTVNLASLDKPLAEAGERIAHSHDFAEQAMRWAESYFPDKPAGWFVLRLALWHSFFHLGQMEHVLRGVGFDFLRAMRSRPDAQSLGIETGEN